MNNNVRVFRMALGWSQEELAEKAGLSRPTITNAELGKHPNMGSQNMQKIATALGRNVKEVFFSEKKYELGVESAEKNEKGVG